MNENIFSFCNQKGGVGKTTSIINIAAVLAKLNFKVLVIDMDAQANATSGVGEEKPSIEFTTYQLVVEKSDPVSLVRKTKFSNLDIIPASSDLAGADIELINKERREFALRDQLFKIKECYDFIFIDCPPSLGLISINALVASDYVIIPIQCEYYALEGLGQLLNILKLVQANLNTSLKVGGVILTMADFRTKLTQQVIEEIRTYFKDKVFHAIVPRSVKVSEAPSFGQPVVAYDAENRGSKAYELITHEFVGRYSKKSEGNETNPAQMTGLQERQIPEGSAKSGDSVQNETSSPAQGGQA